MSPQPAKGLSFSNVGSAGDFTYGGGFGAANCMLDYANAPITDNYTVSSSLPASPLPNGARLVTKLTGNLVINSNIEFANTGGWTSTADTPSFYVVVTGNIYINPAVTRLDGVYIAQPNATGAGGTIYTCTNAAITGPPGSQAEWNSCGQKLTIYGAFMANSIKLLRIGGDVSNSLPTEGP